MKNKVYLIGAGPGRPDLISVRGLNILKEADVVIYDYLVDKGLLEEAKNTAELIPTSSLGKGHYAGNSGDSQSRINTVMVKKAREGKRVIRLKSGDPSIFGRISEELIALRRAKIGFEIVPGITAGIAAASCGIPLTDRKHASSCVFVTGHEASGKGKSCLDWDSISRSGTLVVYMAVGTLKRVTEKLKKAGRGANTPVCVIQEAGRVTQRIVRGTLDSIVQKAGSAGIKPPAVIVVGEVAALEEVSGRLFKNNRVLFTGLSRERYFEDKTYFHLPLLKIEPMKDYSEFDGYLRNIGSFDWIVFASRYGVLHFFRRMKEIGLDARVLHGIDIACVGNSTAGKLLDFGVLADLVPKEESSKGLVKEFKKIGLKGKKVFLPRSDISDKGLEKDLEALGAGIATSFAYRNVAPDHLPDLDLNFFDEVVFTSPSTVRNFNKKYGKLPLKTKASFIGDVTLKEAKRCKLFAQ